jgi:hypothetical protein
MSALEPLCKLIGINPCCLTREENILLEVDLFIRICVELKKFFREQYKDYYRLMKFTIEKEDIMLEGNFMQLIIRDILSTEEYTIYGIANYINTHEDIVKEVAAGLNTSPSVVLFRKIIELHRSVRYELYNAIIKKITDQYLKVA